MHKRLLLLLSMIVAFCTYAGNRGPLQVDFASYESPVNSDMVNMVTGDFTYNLPILNVPGPGGGYNMSLAYHAGIEVEEEASWVGLGWSMNPGVITRRVNQYPDDFKGELMSHYFQSQGSHGYYKNWGIYSESYDSEMGKSGRAGLGSLVSVGLHNSAGFTLLGVNYDYNNNKVTADPVEVATSVATVALMIVFPPSSIALTAGIQVGSSVLGAAVSNHNRNSILTGEMPINMVKYEWSVGRGLQKVNYYNTIYQGARIDKQFGALYLGEVTTSPSTPSSYRMALSPVVKGSSYGYTARHADHIDENIVSDVYMEIEGAYAGNVNPTHIAYDSYSVLADGIQGSISPYRLDFGSVAFTPTRLDPNISNAHLESSSYMVKDWLNSSSSLTYDYRPQFRYTSGLSNSYNYHLNGYDDFGKGNNFGMTQSIVVGTSITNHYDFEADYMTNDTKFLEANRTDNTLIDGKLATGKYIQYFTNDELSKTDGTDVTVNTIYQDHQSSSDRSTFRNTLPADGIGGYVITNSDGKSYHFTLPIYQNSQFYYTGDQSLEHYSSFHDDRIAVAWLLTSITGADYVDRAPIGTVDEGDWGYWVKMHYGKYSESFMDRSPYNGYLSNYSITSNVQENVTSHTFQQYYLNKIETPSHTALFIKSVKKDGKGYYTKNNINDDPNSAYHYPSTSLKLDEIVILTNEFAEHLFKSSTQGGLGLDYTTETTPASDQTVQNDFLDAVLNPYDFTTSQQNELDANLLRKIKFDYDYSLCLGSPNSFTNVSNPPGLYTGDIGSNGKLKLKGVSVFAKDNFKIMPDYLFDYGTNNPNYDKDKYDGWGQYNSTGSDDRFHHQSTDDVGDAWCLKSITTPLGSKISIDYERDSYSTLSGIPARENFFVGRSNSSITDKSTYDEMTLFIKTNQTLSSSLNVGDKINFKVLELYYDNGSTDVTEDLAGEYNIESINGDEIVIHLDKPSAGNQYTWELSSTGGPIGAYVLRSNKIGGGLRTKSITVEDENAETSQIRYVYTDDGSPNSNNSSGVCTQEPGYIHMNEDLDKYPQYRYYDFPGPAVLYSNVNVYTNYTSETDYLSKEIYEFETPKANWVRRVGEHQSGTLTTWNTWTYNNGSVDVTCYEKSYNFNVMVNTSKLGALKSITYLAKDMPYKRVSYDYTELEDPDEFSSDEIGNFTEASLLTERTGFALNTTYIKNVKTTKSYIPSKIKSYTVEENGNIKTMNNVEWDYITGAVLKTEYENTYGDRYQTELIPAYKKYPEMGHILWNSDYKHMLSAQTGKYLRVESEDSPGQWDILQASADVWSNDWVYREDQSGEYDWGSTYTKDAWRRKENYYWKARINKDGTFKDDGTYNFVEFDWDDLASNSSYWQKNGEITHYNHYSSVIASKSHRDVYTTVKYDNKNLSALLTASNANYTEVAYCGLEEYLKTVSGINYIGNEVIQGSSTTIIENLDHVHTGKKSLEVDHGEDGLIYKILDASNNIDTDRQYQLSVWVKDANTAGILPTSAAIDVLYKDDADVQLMQSSIQLSSLNSQKAGDWYLFTIDLPKYTGSSTVDYFETKVKCNGIGTDKIYIDDFRVYPMDAQVVTYVYDYESGLQTAVLDNYNIAIRNSHDEAGRVIKVEKEILDSESTDANGGFKIQSENKYNYGRSL